LLPAPAFPFPFPCLQLQLGAALEWRREQLQSAKDSLSLLPLGTVKKAYALSSSAESKTIIPLGMTRMSSLTRDEKVDVYAATKDAYPDETRGAFSLKLKIALWEADVRKKGGNPGRNLDNVDLSSLDKKDDEEDSAEDSNSSDDGMKAMREDLERQRKVSSQLPQGKQVSCWFHAVIRQAAAGCARKASTG
jgi:hypothetical protein